MTRNSNCLEGIRCPQCGHTEHFFITGTSLFEVYDDGTEGHEDVEWTGDYIRCFNCNRTGKLEEFRAMTGEEKARLIDAITLDCLQDNHVLRDVVRDHVEHTYDLTGYQNYFKDVDPDDDEED